MSADADSREPPTPRADLWTLPNVVEITAVFRSYQPPLAYYDGTRRIEAPETVEFLVRTDGELPARAITPALFVGDVPVPDFETVGENTYLFVAFDPARLRPGAPISLGWSGVTERRVQTGFVFEPQSSADAGGDAGIRYGATPAPGAVDDPAGHDASPTPTEPDESGSAS